MNTNKTNQNTTSTKLTQQPKETIMQINSNSLQQYFQQCSIKALNRTNTTHIQHKLDTQQNTTSTPSELTNIKTRNPKLKTYTIIQDFNNKLSTQQYAYITNLYKNKYKLTNNNIKPHMVKQYAKLINNYKMNYYNTYGTAPKYITQKTKNRLQKQAHEQVTNWNIHNYYSNKYIIIINTQEHLQQSGTTQKHSSGNRHNYSEKSLKQLLRHQNLKLQIIDLNTNITIKHNTTGLNTWNEINETFNTIISELQEQIIITTNNTSTPLNPNQQEQYDTYYQDYKNLPTSQYYKQQHYYNGTYINTYDQYQTVTTQQDVHTTQYLLDNELLETKVPTDLQLEKLQGQITQLELLRHKQIAKSHITQFKDLAITTQLQIETLESTLIDLTTQQEIALSYEAISYKI